MELARDKQTGQEVYAIDLRQQVLEQKDPIASQKMLAQLTAKEYICLGCESFMTPVAIKPDMKVSPHFRIKKKEQHQENCHISRYDNLVQVGLTQQVSKSSGFPVKYPSKLRLFTERNVTSEESWQDSRKSTGTSPKTITASVNSNPASVSDELRHSTTTMLGQIVKHFLSFPHDRHLSLHLPFVKTTNYQDGFKKIDFDSGNSYEKLLIYYGEFMYIGVEITSQEIYLPLMQGLNIFDKLTGKPVFLKVDISHWTTSQKDYITQQIEKCRAEARASRSYDYNSRKQPWLFFFGKQSPQNKFQFQLIRDDWRLLYCQTIQVSNLSNL